MSPKSTLPKLTLVLLITLLTMSLAATAGAQAKPWTTVGSAVGSACFGASLDFLDNAYFMDVEISKTKPNGTPALAMIKLDLGIC